ncbi:MAG TPA: endo-1,3-alpha-glucanase family glycosylhydrolase [Capsulimonadaceae bacterium]|jgi:formylglycine-generating enzyme required for sulfatase activity
MIRTKFTLIMLALFAALFTLTVPAKAAPLADNDRHIVFAHYMTCFGSTVEFYKQEIELAQRHGIDGFALNCGDWMQVDPATGATKDGYYVTSALRMYEAARQLNSGFKLFFSADVAGLKNLPINMGDMVKRFANHPNQFRAGGKQVISAWGGHPETYAEAIKSIKAAGYDICFVPFMSNAKYAMAWSPETVASFFNGQPHMDGIYTFATDGIPTDLVIENATGCRVSHAMDKIFMAGTCPAMNSPNLRDYRGLEGYGTMWEGLIRDDADWVEIVTWNDYNEDTNLMPYRWQGGDDREYYDRDEAPLDATAYYSAWYKSGKQPAITQDKVYVSYRNRSKWLHKAWSEKKKEWVDVTTYLYPFDQIHDDVRDEVSVTTFLTAPAQLTVTTAKGTQTFAMPAGIGHANAAYTPGTPRFSLTRDKAPVLSFSGRKLIISDATQENSEVGYHLLNRTWISGAAAGPVKTLIASSGKLTSGATVESLGARKLVRNTETAGSGFALPVEKLATSTYNIRVTYSNPSPREARLTMTANGPDTAQGAFPYFIPLYLPPTPKGQTATLSFFWSLYSSTSEIAVKWLPGTSGGKPHVASNDSGSVLIDTIDLVKVEPVATPAPRTAPTPELVAVPGGSFTMGASAGNPDEKPVHKVTLAPFSIAKYEVTNDEYERFDPAHKAFRDSYSWRNREPVIYVSWLNAAAYCNWLSAQSGLTPAYREQEVKDGANVSKRWIVDMATDGYRLPTEAEWEYVATGRGEGRTYPWGNKVPDTSRGNLQIAPLEMTSRIPSNPGLGVMVVGSYPDGASRDGVFDLAGNVSEWCSDWFNAYPADAQTNPCSQDITPYRSIRGGSWGYYNYSQRNADREYNSAVYPGYIYIGFRVVLPEKGKARLAGK